MTILLLRLIVTYCPLNTAVHPASHSFQIETSELCMSLSKMCPRYDSLGKDDKSSNHVLLDFMVYPFGHLTGMGGPIIVDGRRGVSGLR